jgi:hypothetical protein
VREIFEMKDARMTQTQPAPITITDAINIVFFVVSMAFTVASILQFVNGDAVAAVGTLGYVVLIGVVWYIATLLTEFLG